MEPSSKGWIDQYLAYLSIQTGESKYRSFIDKISLPGEKDKSLYKFLQPSGLMYGYPIRTGSVNIPGMKNWSENDRMKIILLDSLIHSSILYKSEHLSSERELTELLTYASNELNHYYLHLYPQINVQHKTMWGRKKSDREITEEIIYKRLYARGSISASFWTSFFQNSLLFLDVFYFGKWISDTKTILSPEKINSQQQEMRMTILKIIAAAAHANRILETEEKMLFEYFLQSSYLSKERELEAREHLKEGIDLESITLPSQSSWILRKYMLELAILTIWSDKIVEETEKDFIDRLGKKLSFRNNEVEESMLAIESFVITNWEHVHYLQKKHDIHIIKKRFTRRISFILNKNKDALAQELKESAELVRLLKKSTVAPLEPKEKLIIREQLMDILKTLPTFVVIALPGTFITLPLLLRLLPRSAFPSAFNAENIS